ncbi:MAG TPA: TIGR00300 family protein [Steroidobacteraceae bacterium]|nr:TIGR00300 family protein [Steroidobacteraceae bacterium]
MPGTVSETVEAEGHLIDSGNFQAILTTVVEHGSEYEILRFDVGRNNAQGSHLTLQLTSDSDARLQDLLSRLTVFGCFVKGSPDVLLRPADMDGAAPVDFYSTTNHRTAVVLNGEWIDVDHQRMDAALVVKDGTVSCRKLREIRKGDQIVCGMQGIRVTPDVQQRDKPSFGFMSNEVSSERRVETSVKRVAEMMRRVKAEGGKIAFVAGPVMVHTGGSEYFCRLIELGYVDVLLSGNAIAVHDIEVALSGTSLGIDLSSGHPVEHGHRNHMRAINAVRRAGGIGKAVETGVLTSGIMHACHTHGVQYILAGSIRDDGPLPETMMDLIAAQDAYGKALEGVEVVVMLSSMLHSIGVGNMLPSWVKVICVDINPAVVTKLSDRGSTQTIGIVTDVGLFLHQLAEQLKS